MIRAVLVGLGLGVVIDLAAAYIWLVYITDGPEFPY